MKYALSRLSLKTNILSQGLLHSESIESVIPIAFDTFDVGRYLKGAAPSDVGCRYALVTKYGLSPTMS